MLVKYIYHKPFKVKFPDKCEGQNRFNPDYEQDLVWYTLGSTPRYSGLKYMPLRPVKSGT
jgi:hypothetical protein